MDKKQLSERDICTKYITPALTRAGWDILTQIREEFVLTQGRIVVRGKLHTRAQNKRADYVLFYKPNIPIAIIEAKDNNHSLGDGMQQGLGYAEILLNPACGMSGFLVNTIEHPKTQVKNSADQKILQATVNGMKKKPLPHMLAMTNVMLHGIDVPSNIRHDNTLSRPLRDYSPKDRVGVIVTNSPFGGMEEDGIESNFLKKYQTQETADLFMALITHLLKHDTGRATVVLPDGFLFGEGVKTTLKRELLEEFNLHTIVRLPKGVFSPYTSINTNILFFEKGEPTKEVWFFEHPYPEGYKSYSRSKPLTIQEFEREKKWWGGALRKGRKKNEYAWKVSAKELAERNYHLDCKNPYELEVDHGDPEVLMAEYLEIDRQLEAAQNALKQELMNALGAG
jgi:type I restriction enzyme M protein